MNQVNIWDYEIEFQEDKFLNDARIRYDNLVDVLERYKNNDKNKKLLEIGFGTGYFLEKLSENFECYGIDYSPKTVEFAKNKFRINNRIKVSQQSIENINFENNYFDVVIAVEVIEHLPEDIRKKGTKEVSRVLKSNGVFIGTVPANENLKENTVFCPYCKKSFHRYGHQISFSEASLRNLLNENGFECEIKHIFFWDKQAPLPKQIFEKLRKLYVNIYKKDDAYKGGNYLFIAKKIR